MADELTGVLQEIATLLRRQVEQHDAMVERGREMQARFSTGTVGAGFGREEFEKRREAGQAEMRERGEKYREEDRQYKRDLLAALDRHNRTLESILARWEKSS